jgi:hypothetical protein
MKLIFFYFYRMHLVNQSDWHLEWGYFCFGDIVHWRNLDLKIWNLSLFFNNNCELVMRDFNFAPVGHVLYSQNDWNFRQNHSIDNLRLGSSPYRKLPRQSCCCCCCCCCCKFYFVFLLVSIVNQSIRSYT